MLIDIIAVICGILGIAGCILPVIPGPPLSWVGMLLLYIADSSKVSTTSLIIWLVVAVVVTVLDYIIPAYFTRVTGGSKSSGKGSLVGLLVGIFFFPPWGMLLGAFLGAIFGEMFLEGKELRQSLKPAFGSLVGFLFSTGFKLVASITMMVLIIRGL